MSEFLNKDVIYMLYILSGAMSFSLVCAGISNIIDAKGRFNYNTYWDDKDIVEEGKQK